VKTKPISAVRPLLLRFTLLLLQLTTLSAAELAKIDLFEARKGGYHTYRIPGIVSLGHDTLFAWVEARRTGTGDWEDIDILSRVSRDGGATWEPARRLVDAETKPAHNGVALVDSTNGSLHFIYCVNYSQAFHMRSDDGGVTFTRPMEITEAFRSFNTQFLWNVIATGPGHGLQLRAGRFIVPVWLSNGGKRHRPSAVGVIYSDDHGATWQAGDLVPNTLINMSETGAVEREDGSVLFNIRSEDRERRRAISISKDGVHQWSRPKFDPALVEPVCFGALTRLTWSEGGRPGRILFCNPDSQSHSGKHGPSYDGNMDRVNLTIRMSRDDGATWPVSRVLEPGVTGYSDLTPGPAGSFCCVYERDGVGGSMWDTKFITFIRLDPNWLEAGK
jgi:sialidase-1